MAVKENRTRIVGLEDDVKDIEKRIIRLEHDFALLISKMDVVIKMGRITLGLVAAALGLDLGINGGIV
jgi:hypothetical protein